MIQRKLDNKVEVCTTMTCFVSYPRLYSVQSYDFFKLGLNGDSLCIFEEVFGVCDRDNSYVRWKVLKPNSSVG
jgi:hypothetical protein